MGKVLDKVNIAKVVSIEDKTCAGRIKCRVDGLHDNISDEQLPWCSFAGSGIFSGNGGGSISIPRVGQYVRVQFKDDKATSMEWTGTNQIDKDLINELAGDYAGSQVLMYDSASDLSIKFQPKSGLLIYFGGSHILILPDNTINIHYGEGASGTQIQLSSGKIDIQAQNEINLTTSGTMNLSADSILINGKSNVQIKGDMAGDCAVNGLQLMTALSALADLIDKKLPESGGVAKAYINSVKEGVLNQKIQLI